MTEELEYNISLEEKIDGWMEGISAEFPSFAALAAETGPDAVEVVHRRLHELRVVGQYAGLESTSL